MQLKPVQARTHERTNYLDTCTKTSFEMKSTDDKQKVRKKYKVRLGPRNTAQFDRSMSEKGIN